MLSEYFITTKDLFGLIRKIIVGIPMVTIAGELLMVAWAAVMFFVLHWPLEAVFFVTFLAALIYWNIEGRVSIGIGLICFVLIIIMQLLVDVLISLPLQQLSENVAVWAFYFLAIGVIKQIYELALEHWSKKLNE